WGRALHFNVFRNRDLLNRLAQFDELGGAGLRVDVQLTALGPVVCLIVMIGVAKKEAGFRAVDDNSDVAIYPCRPEIAVFGFFDSVELKTGLSGVGLDVEGRGFHGFLLVAGQAGEAVGKSIGDAEFHRWMFSPGNSLVYRDL